MAFEFPTSASVHDACERFDSENKIAEDALGELFRRFPLNSDLNHVVIKAVALNSLYSTRIYIFSSRVPNILDVAEHIYKQAPEIDAYLKDGSPDVVELISEIEIAGKASRDFFSFASKYCAWHRPDQYPIWDSNVERYLTALRKQEGFAKDFPINGHWTYAAFRSVMSDLRDRAKCSFKELDQFIWMAADAEESKRAAGA